MIASSQFDYRALVDHYGSPLLILDKAIVRHQYRDLTNALPGVKLRFAVKSLPHEGILKVLRDLGCGFDLATSGEIDLVQSLNIKPNVCVHTHPIKKDPEIQAAIDFGVVALVFDNECELEKFIPYKDKAKLLLRISFPNPHCSEDLSKKFGCTPESAVTLLQKAIDLGIKVVGFSFHVGSQCENSDKHCEAI